MKILIVEDNPKNLKLASGILARSGYSVISAEDGDSGLLMARQERPDLILMDIQLPGMDGLTATKLLKGAPETSHIKIIALTAFAMKGDRERMIAAGCDDYISKPIRYKEFLATVASWLPKE
ncbi:MAG: response regulator [Proteobacteria bacterium]|nr:response regulator [Desulfobulbaceae bacterium]MBU4153699.1 response regulator [Pseudomonadota bacterium]MDP2104497.1 response regulator [Desulfobulbaceae bacterium]